MKKTVVVTGAAGYIGGQTALMLADMGHRVVGIDKTKCPKRLKSVFHDYIEKDFAHKDALIKVLIHEPAAIVHCAGNSLVGPSIRHPGRYFENNVENTITLLDQVRRSMPKTRVIFSSSAATYGDPIMTPVQEIDPTEPISPYGESKLMIDWMLKSYQRAYGLDFVSFRYFNACGADSQGRHGQAPGATHIIARILESIRDNKDFILYGTDYPTKDGTCIRDYIHVEDLAEAHILAMDKQIPSDIYNLGTNTGYSNLEVIQSAAQITGINIPVLHGPQREGDPAILTADAGKFMGVSSWQPKFVMTDIISHAWQWYQK